MNTVYSCLTDGIPIDENQPIDFSKTTAMADIDGVPLEDIQNIDGQPLEEDVDKEPSETSKCIKALFISCNVVYLKQEPQSGMYNLCI